MPVAEQAAASSPIVETSTPKRVLLASRSILTRRHLVVTASVCKAED